MIELARHCLAKVNDIAAAVRIAQRAFEMRLVSQSHTIQMVAALGEAVDFMLELADDRNKASCAHPCSVWILVLTADVMVRTTSAA
jgi:hypothetical protein